jgi:hypothetical protein
MDRLAESIAATTYNQGRLMFRCYFCQQVTPPKTTRHTVIIETREKQYSTRRRESKGGGGRRNFRSRDEPPQDRGGKGYETSKEVAACPACAAKHHEVSVIPTAPPASAEAPASAAPETGAGTPADAGTPDNE